MTPFPWNRASMERPHLQPDSIRLRGLHSRRGFTAVAAVLTALLLAGFVALALGVMWTSGGGARRATCTTQLKDLVAALNMYRTERGDYPPASYQAADPRTGEVELVTWADLIRPYLSRTDILTCRGSKPTPNSRNAAQETASNYWYVRGRPTPVNPAPSRQRTLPPEGLAAIDRDQVAKHRVLLVCRGHEPYAEPDRQRVLIAYEDGTVKWERLPSYLAPKKPTAYTPKPNRNDW